MKTACSLEPRNTGSLYDMQISTQGVMKAHVYDINHYRMFFSQLTDTGCYSSVISSPVWNDRRKNKHICYRQRVCLQKKSRPQTSSVLSLKTAIFLQLALGFSFLLIFDYYFPFAMKWTTSKSLAALACPPTHLPGAIIH